MENVGEIRPEFLSGPIVYGNSLNIYLPTNIKRKGQFAVVDLDSIIASHDHNTFSSSDGYPLTKRGTNINDRNYSGDFAAQAAVKRYAQDLVPERIISTSVEESGTPIITVDGFVISGNNRTMSLKLASEQFPDKYSDYKEYLLNQSETFGIDRSIMQSIVDGNEIIDRTGQFTNAIKFNRPALVRFDYEFPEYTTAQMAYYNKGTMKAEALADKTIKLSKILEESERCTEIIANVIGQYENASDLYSSKKDQKTVAQYLLDCDLLTQQELSAYFEHGAFTNTGKEFIESLLSAMILNEEALTIANKPGVKKLRNNIVTGILILIQNSKLSEGSLKEDINQAVILQGKIVDSELDFKHYMAQSEMWGDSFSYRAAFLNRLLLLSRNVFKEAISGYNKTMALSQESMGMFEDAPDQKEAFEFYIIDSVSLIDRKIIENSPKISYTDLDLEDETDVAKARAKAKIKILRLKNRESKN